MREQKMPIPKTKFLRCITPLTDSVYIPHNRDLNESVTNLGQTNHTHTNYYNNNLFFT